MSEKIYDVVLRDVNKVYPNGFHAVYDFNINIEKGEFIVMAGPSGCGKSTTLFMLSGLESPTEGQIFFGEDDVTTLAAEKRGIGLVFQNYALYPHMTVEQNIMFPLLNMRIPKEEAKIRALEAAGLVQIQDLMARKPNELSGGQQQRVAIARALVKMPNVLLLDEPLSNLDARLRLQTREEIKRIQQETGITTVFVTHDQEEAMSISDVIVVMKLGVVQQMDAPQKVYDDPANLFVAQFLGAPPINTFEGRIEGGKVYIGDEAVMDTTIADQEVFIGIRPEGFEIDKAGKFTVNIQNVEVMGRDISVIANHNACLKPTLRIIIDADNQVANSGALKLRIKPNKIFLFNKETEERLREE